MIVCSCGSELPSGQLWCPDCAEEMNRWGVEWSREIEIVSPLLNGDPE